MTDDTLPAGSAFADPSLWGIFAGNLFSIVLAYTQDWSFAEILWTYWAQSIVIGLVNVYRMSNLQNFSTTGLNFGAAFTAPTIVFRKFITVFFIIHYGSFHLGYATFLAKEMPFAASPTTALFTIFLGVAGFVSAHVYSYQHNKPLDFKNRQPNIGHLMFYPYIRILPMHLVIVFGMHVESEGMLLFMALKTVADVVMHVIEHKIFRTA